MAGRLIGAAWEAVSRVVLDSAWCVVSRRVRLDWLLVGVFLAWYARSSSCPGYIGTWVFEAWYG